MLADYAACLPMTGPNSWSMLAEITIKGNHGQYS